MNRDSPDFLGRLASDLVLAQLSDDHLPLTSPMAGDHEEVVFLRRDGFPFTGSDLNSAQAVKVSAFTEERDDRHSSIDCGVVKGLVPSSKQLLVLLTAGVPIH